MAITEKDVIALEDQRYAATIALDTTALGRIYHDRLVYTHSSGAIDDKASLIGSMGKKYRYTAAKRMDEKVQIYGDTAFVTGKALLNVEVFGEAKVLDIAFLAVWVNTDQGWRFVAWQSCKRA